MKYTNRPKKSRLHALILDFDGVVVDSVGTKDRAFQEIFSRFPGVFHKAMDYHYRNSGLSRVEKFRFMISRLPVDNLENITVESLCNEFSQKVVEKVINCPFVTGAVEMLRYFKGYLPLYLASVTPQEELEFIIKKRNLATYFTRVCGGTCVKEVLIREILREHRLDPCNVIFVGDTLQDYEASKATSVQFIGLRSQHVFPVEVTCFETNRDILNFIVTKYLLTECSKSITKKEKFA